MTLSQPVFALARIRRATLLFDRDGLEILWRAIEDESFGTLVRTIDRLKGRADEPRSRLEALAVRTARARWQSTPRRRKLASLLGSSPRYLAVGHAGWAHCGLGAFASLDGARSAVMVHDTIPLDHPEFQKLGTPERFRWRLAFVAKHADIVVAPLKVTAAEVRGHLAVLSEAPPPVIVAPPGVVLPAADPSGPKAAAATGDPYFVALGTIEPRKNHALLLSLWERLGRNAPRLFVIGRRGWASPEVFARLDRLAATGRVEHLSGLSDAEVSARLAGARALLFPSMAEGFGYPPAEALSLGTPVVANDLPQTRELLGESVVYVASGDHYQWIQAIGAFLSEDRVPEGVPNLPRWDAHFNVVLNALR